MQAGVEGQQSDKEVIAKILEELKVVFFNFDYLINSEVRSSYI